MWLAWGGKVAQEAALPGLLLTKRELALSRSAISSSLPLSLPRKPLLLPKERRIVPAPLPVRHVYSKAGLRNEKQ